MSLDPDTTPPPPLPPPGAPSEPLLSVGFLTAAFAALLACMVSFGVPVNDDQQAKLLALILILAPLIVAGIGRLRVWSPASVRRAVLAERAGGHHRAP